MGLHSGAERDGRRRSSRTGGDGSSGRVGNEAAVGKRPRVPAALRRAGKNPGTKASGDRRDGAVAPPPLGARGAIRDGAPATWPARPDEMRRYVEEWVVRDGFAVVELRLAGLELTVPLSLEPGAVQHRLDLAHRELEQLESEAHRFAKRFEVAADQTAQAMLKDSEREIAQVLGAYGVDNSPAALAFASDLLIKDPDLLGTAVEALVRGSKSGRHREAFAAKAPQREGLRRAAKPSANMPPGLSHALQPGCRTMRAPVLRS